MSVVPVRTDDGSITLRVEEVDETYHSRRGALAESMHVYVNAGLLHAAEQFGSTLQVLEIGFGTGLNTLLTFQIAREKGLDTKYTTLETNPISPELIPVLGYGEATNHPEDATVFARMHESSFEEITAISSFFTLEKRKEDVRLFSDIRERYHLIYFDAFGPRVQPELWEEAVFKKLIDVLLPGGILVTYCSKTVVRRAMEAAGFTVEKLQGPRGKREMVRAFKLI